MLHADSGGSLVVLEGVKMSFGRSRPLRSLVALAVVALLLTTPGCLPQHPADTVVKCFEALDEKDFDAVIDCLDPSVRRQFDAMSNIASNFLGGVQMKDILALSPTLFSFMKGASGSPADYRVEVVDVLEERVDGDRAVVVVRIRTVETDEDGRRVSREENAQAILKHFDDAGWRIVE